MVRSGKLFQALGNSTRGILSTIVVRAIGTKRSSSLLRITWLSLFLCALFEGHWFVKAKGRVSHEYLCIKHNFENSISSSIGIMLLLLKIGSV